jgi:Flp pilus assembly pilin Flp
MILLAMRKRLRRCQGHRNTLAALALADSGQAVTEYALVSAIFGILMIVAMVAVQHNAGAKLNNTQTSLSNEYTQVHG